MVDLAIRNLLHDKVRFAATVCGVAFAVALTTTQSAILLGAMSNASVVIEQCNADFWVVARGVSAPDISRTFDRALVARARALPEVEAASTMMFVITQMTISEDRALERRARTDDIQLIAMEDFADWNVPFDLPEGDTRSLGGRHVILDDSATKRVGAFRIGENRHFAGTALRVIGRSRNSRVFSLLPVGFVDTGTLEELVPATRGRTQFVLVRARRNTSLEALRARLEERYPEHTVLSRDEYASKATRYWLLRTGIGIALALQVLLGAGVGVVIVAQTLYVSTMHHLREFATLKAIGGSNKDIYRVLIKQAFVCALLGFVLGGLPPIFLQRVVQGLLGTRVIVSPALALAVFVGTLALCCAAALISFVRVRSTDPALVFRS